MRYGVWGAARDSLSNLPTARLYTGQESNTGLYYYNARWYDSELGRFVQPDTIIPNQYNPVTLDRFAYSRNNPINFNDPTGHDMGCGGQDSSECGEKTALGIDRRQHSRLVKLREDAFRLSRRMKAEEITDVEALARLWENDSSMYSDGSIYLKELGIVVGGLEVKGTILEHGLSFARGEFEPSDAFSTIDQNHPLGQYFVGYSAFDPEKGKTGFDINLNPKMITK